MPQRHEDIQHRLLLLRHTKSSWEESGQRDHERPLNARGRRTGELLASHLAKHDAPDLVICSSALRTRETLDLIAPSWKRRPNVLIEDDVYLASATTLLKRIAKVPEEIGTLLVIGHNPGLHELAAALGAHCSRGLQARLAKKFPTGTLAAFVVAEAWRRIAPARIVSGDLVTPADLSPDESDD